MRPTVIISEHLDETCSQWLCEHAQVIKCSYQNRDEFYKHLSAAQGLVVRTYTQVNPELLDAAPNLKVVARAGVGLDNIDIPACNSRGVQVVYTPDANTHAVVQYVFALILDALRPRQSFNMPIDGSTFKQMRQDLVGTQINGQTLGILGFGRIGQCIGQVAHAFGLNVLAYDILPPNTFSDLPTTRYPYSFVPYSTLFQDSDILTIHTDGRLENHHLINQKVLSQLKPTCTLINTARGTLIDNQALLAWANSVKHQGGQAILDVHDPEPPNNDYCLYGLSNVCLLPHLASRTNQAMQAMSWVVRDVVAVLQGEDPKHPA